MYLRLLLIVSCFVLILGCTPKTADEYLTSAEELERGEKYQQAIIELKNAIISAPNNKKARIQLGKVYYKTGQFLNAEKELRKAIELGEPKSNVLNLLVKAVYYQDDFDRAFLLSKGYQSEDDDNSSTISLFNYLSELKSEYSRETLPPLPKTLIGDDKLIAQAYQYLSIGELDKALVTLEAFKDTSREPVEKLLLAGFIYSQLDKKEQAIKVYSEVLAIIPTYYFVRFQLANLLIETEELSKAQKEVDFLLDINSESAYANLLQSKIYFKTEKFEGALLTSEKAIQGGIITVESNFIAGISAFKQHKPETAYSYLSQVSPYLPPGHIANRIFAETKLQLGYIEEVLTQLKTVSPSKQESSELLGAVATERLVKGDLEAATDYLKKANNLDNSNAINQLKEGFARLSTNDLNGIKNLQAAIQFDDSINEAWMLLIEANLKNGDTESALDIARKWQTKNPGNGLTMEAYINLILNQNNEARTLLDKALKSQPDHLGASRFLMLLNAREEKFNDAREIAESLINRMPSNFLLMIDLMNISLAETRSLDLAESFLTKIHNQNPLEPSPLAALGILYAWTGEPNKTIDLLKTDPTDPTVLMVLGDTYFREKKFKEAINIFKLWIEKQPYDIRPWFRSISLYETIGDLSMASQTAKIGVEKFPNDPRMVALNANFMIDEGKLVAANNQLNSISKFSKLIPGINLFKGKVALKQKDFELAKTILSQYYETTPSFETAVYLAQALQELGQAPKGADILERELKNLKVAYSEVHTVAEYLSRNKMYDKAAKYYELFLTKNPNDFVTLNNYALVQVERNQLDSAKALAHEAFNIQPKSPYILDTLGWISYKSGNTAEGLGYISKAFELAPENIEIKLHLAELLIDNGQASNARKIIQNIDVQESKIKLEVKRLNEMLNK